MSEFTMSDKPSRHFCETGSLARGENTIQKFIIAEPPLKKDALIIILNMGTVKNLRGLEAGEEENLEKISEKLESLENPEKIAEKQIEDVNFISFHFISFHFISYIFVQRCKRRSSFYFIFRVQYIILILFYYSFLLFFL